MAYLVLCKNIYLKLHDKWLCGVNILAVSIASPIPEHTEHGGGVYAPSGSRNSQFDAEMVEICQFVSRNVAVSRSCDVL